MYKENCIYKSEKAICVYISHLTRLPVYRASNRNLGDSHTESHRKYYLQSIDIHNLFIDIIAYI